MQRDMDLVRKILLAMDEHEHGYAPEKFPSLNAEGYSEDQIGFHVWLMAQAGLIVAKESTLMSSKSPQSIPIAINWEGYEFLSAIKEQAVWEQSKALVWNKSGALGFELLKGVAMQLLKQSLGL